MEKVTVVLPEITQKDLLMLLGDKDVILYQKEMLIQRQHEYISFLEAKITELETKNG